MEKEGDIRWENLFNLHAALGICQGRIILQKTEFQSVLKSTDNPADSGI
jgi:hypothetical protein